MSEINLIFIGDELITGRGDARALGWVGRVMARTNSLEVIDAPSWSTLAVPGEVSAQLSNRWRGEAARRVVPGARNLLVIGVGVADVTHNVSTARSSLALANIIDAAVMYEKLECLMVGPPPLTVANPKALAALNNAAREVCRRRNVTYVDTYTPLVKHEQWLTDIALNDGAYPGQAGYGLLAWLVLHRGWNQWLGL